MRRQRGFTLVELLVVLVLIGILIVVGCKISSEASRIDGERSVCMTQLRRLARVITNYRTAHSGKFPRVHSEGDPLAAETPHNDLKGISTNAMNQVWVLIDGGYADETYFKCPGHKLWSPRTTTLKYGWTDPSEFSYGIQYPFDHDPARKGANPACPASAAYRSDWILMGDRNPGKRVTSKKDWLNHPDGCAYLKMDGSVAFHRDSTSVISGEEIYGDDNAADGDVFPDSAGDVVILPDGPGD